jgi:hypothetical protein
MPSTHALKELIATCEERLTKKYGERKWQVFFEANPFILSTAFSVPAMLVETNPYVGGARFDRRGGKIADFLLGGIRSHWKTVPLHGAPNSPG